MTLKTHHHLYFIIGILLLKRQSYIMRYLIYCHLQALEDDYAIRFEN